jgi:hypothetical protein
MMSPFRLNRRTFAAVTMTVCAMFGGGCQSTSAPRLEHAAASVTDRTPEGVAMSFTMDAFNDNDIHLPLRDVHYSVWIGEREVFRGTRSAEATLRRKGVQQLRLPAVIALEPGELSPSGMQEFRLRGTMTYVTPGKIAELLFDSGVRVPTVGFATEGQIDFGAVN